MIRQYEDYTVTANNFDDFIHFCQWVKTISGTQKTIEELEKDSGAQQAWKRIEMEGEMDLNPTLWFDS